MPSSAAKSSPTGRQTSERPHFRTRTSKRIRTRRFREEEQAPLLSPLSETCPRLADRQTPDRSTPVGVIRESHRFSTASEFKLPRQAPRSEFTGSSSLFFKVRPFRSPVEYGGFVLCPLLTAGTADLLSQPGSGFRRKAYSRTWIPALPG
jgi:hypothetical protein